MSTSREQNRSSEPRPYRMRARADAIDNTRRRIVEAAVALHTTIGPAGTTISAIAEKAGVTRLTVYRHYPDDERLFIDCTSHWSESHPGPDPSTWREIVDLEERARTAIEELYDWYHVNGDELIPIMRDIDVLPDEVVTSIRSYDAELAEALVSGSRSKGRALIRQRAAASHVTSLWTWMSLERSAGLPTREAARLASSFMISALRGDL